METLLWATDISESVIFMRAPEIVSIPPGSESQKVIDKDTKYLATSTKTSPIVGVRGEGAVVWDADGNTLLDFTSGIGVTNTGHCHPKVVKAVQDQAGKLVHFAGTDFYYSQQADLAEKLSGVTPGDHDKKVFFTNSGAESVEAAVKVSKWNKNKHQFIAFRGGFHGRTLGALAFTASKYVQKERFFPWMPGVIHVPYPNPYRPPVGVAVEDLTEHCIAHIESLFDTMLGDQGCAIVAEPVQGEGGYIVPPMDFYPALKKLAEDHDLIFIDDEVQAGFGRTGKMFATEHFNVVPDIITIAKGMGSGMPIGAAVFRADLDFGVEGAHSNTYGGNLVACASASATIDVIQEENLLGNCVERGVQLKEGFLELQEKYDLIGDVRGLGLMLATEFVKDRKTKEFAIKERNAICEEAYKMGLILLPCGRSAIRYIPALVVTDEQIKTALDIMEKAIQKVV